MGKGKDSGGKGKDKRGGGRQFSAPEDMVAKQPARGMPSSDDDDDDDEEEVPQQQRGGQSKNAGMMPPSESEEEDSEEESDDDDPPPTAHEMAAFIKSKGLGKEFLTWLAKARKAPKAGKAPAGYEMSRQEAAKKKQRRTGRGGRSEDRKAPRRGAPAT